MKVLLQKVPFDDGEKPGSKDLAVLKVRKMVAERWLLLRSSKFQGSEAERVSATKEYGEYLDQMVEYYGSETPFAPRPPKPIPFAGSVQDQPSPGKEPATAEADRICPPHCFRFLPNSKGVFTVLQAGTW